MANGLSEYLPHFTSAVFDGIDIGGAMKPLSGEAPMATALDPIAEAEARGRREAEASAKLEFESLRAEEKSDFEFRLAEKEEYWRTQTSEVLVAAILDGLGRIEAAIADQTASAIALFLHGAIRERALAELSQTLTMLLADRAAIKITIGGPPSLVERLGEVLAAQQVELVANGRPEVTVKIDDTVIETCLSAWATRIDSAVVGVRDV